MAAMWRLRIGVVLALCGLLVGVGLAASGRALAQDDCATARLAVGGQGQVTPGSANRVRSAPSTEGEVLGTIPAGGVFDVLEGPTCTAGLLWWRVDYDGLAGWTVEASGQTYFVAPVEDTPAATASPAATGAAPQDCPLEPRLLIGELARTTSADTPSRLRDAPSTTGTQVGQIEPLDLAAVLDGPLCAGGILWWQVQLGAITGWTAEAVEGEYLLQPVAPTPTPLPTLTPAPTATPVVVVTPTPVPFDLPRALAWSPDGRWLAVGTGEGVYLYDPEDWTAPPRQVAEGRRVSDLAFHPLEDNLLLTNSRDEGLVVYGWDVDSGAAVVQLGAGSPIQAVYSLDFSANGALLVLNYAGIAAVYDAGTWDPLLDVTPELPPFDGERIETTGYERLALSPDGALLATVHNSAIYVADWQPFQVELVALDGGATTQLDRGGLDTRIQAVAFSPDGRQVIVGDERGSLQLWEIETLRRTAFIRGEGRSASNMIHAIAFHPEGGVLATAESDPQGVVRIFETAGLRQVASYGVDSGTLAVYDLAYSPDGALLAAIVDGTVRLLETEGYTLLAALVHP